MTAQPAEHARFHGYVTALARVSDAGEADLIAVVLCDPDQVMAHSAVIGHLDRRAAALSDGESFAAWSRRIVPFLDGHDLPERRLREWSLFKKIGSGQPFDTRDLVEASDWLQRKLSDEAEARDVLSVLAESGRTSRIRNTAHSRIGRQPG